MVCTLINGKQIANTLQVKIADLVDTLKKKHFLNPTLAILQVGNDEPSSIYVKNKLEVLKKLNMSGRHLHLPDSVAQRDVEKELENLNNDTSIHGILLQLPLPAHLDKIKLLQYISPKKDVDGLTIYNQGLFFNDIYTGFIPCTPLGCLYLLKKVIKDLSGKIAVVIGRSNLTGKPLSLLLLRQGCTVIQAHSQTKNLMSITKQADILVAATGTPKLIRKEMLKPGVKIIDVGINRLPSGGLCGDVDYQNAKEIAGAITPVPGGVGPMTVTMLMLNTLQATYRTLNIRTSLYETFLDLQ